MRFRKAAMAALVVVCSLVAAAAVMTAALTTTSVSTAEAAPPPGKGKPTPTPTPTATPIPPPANPADAEFVSMMIPHHYQAILMSQMAPGRSTDQNLLALASQIEAEQNLEIMIMQGWQTSNGLEPTDPAMAYHHLTPCSAATGLRPRDSVIQRRFTVWRRRGRVAAHIGTAAPPGS